MKMRNKVLIGLVVALWATGLYLFDIGMLDEV
jgi:hypothetical protein